MTTGLPMREFHELAPPEGGALAVRREARRRRRLRAATSSGAAVVVLVVTALLLHVGGPVPRESLVVTDEPTTRTSASPRATTSSPPSPASTPVAGRPRATGAPVVPEGTAAPATAAPQGQQQAPDAYRTPDLARRYDDRASFGSVSLCSGSVTGSDQQLQYTVAWCPYAVVTQTGRGHDLVAQVCRDGSSDARLTFGTVQEVELTVQRSDGTVVWRWSTGHSDARRPHALDVARDHCWQWTAPWTDVDGRGAPLPSGDYVLSVTSRADELRTAPVATAAFSL